MVIIALLALGLVVFESVADVLPDQAVTGALTPVRLVVAAGLLALLPSIRRPDRATFAWRVPFDACVALLLVGAGWSAHTSGAWPEWRGLLTCVAVAYLASAVLRSSPEAWHGVCVLALLAVGTAGLTGVRQTVTGAPTGFCRGALDGSADACGHPGVIDRAVGTFGNPKLLAAARGPLPPVALAGALALTTRSARVMGYLTVAAGGAGVAATGSRAGLLAVLVSLAAYLVLRRPTAARLAIGTASATVLVSLGWLLSVLGLGVGVRADVWAAAGRLVREHPWGVGVGRTGPVIDAAVPGDEAFRHAHNWWLDTLLESGPLGLVGAVGLTVLAAVCVVRAARRGSTAGMALGSGLAGFAVLCLLDDPTNAIRNAYAAWIVLGLAVSAGHGVRHRGVEVRGAQVSPSTADAPVAEGSAAGGAGASGPLRRPVRRRAPA